MKNKQIRKRMKANMNMEEIREKWPVIKEIIKTEYGLIDISYKTWVEPLRFHSVKNNVVNIIVPQELSQAYNYISSKYIDFFKVTIAEMFNHQYDIKFVLEKDLDNLDITVDSAPKHNPVYNINYEFANLNPKYNFDTFVVGNNNRVASSASVAVAESPGEVYNPLYIYGKPGLGKTHLMHSIGHYILRHNPEKKVLYITSEQFMNEVIESIRSGNAITMNKLREKYRTVDVLMIDDIQFIIGKDTTQEEFFHTFNVLHNAGKQIVLSSDKPPKEIKTLDERFISRFEWGLIVDIQPPDYETRVAILQKNIEAYNIELDDEILHYIATNIKSNIRELEGALNKIMAFAKLNKVNLTIDLAEEALKDVIYPSKTKNITPTLIIDVVAEQFGVKPEDITSKRRNSEFVLPRHVSMYLCRTMIDTSLINIAKIMGKKDHTTVINGVERITSELQRNEELKNKIDIIIKKLNSP